MPDYTAPVNPASTTDKLLRPHIVAKMLDVSRMTVYRLFRYGELEGLRTSPRNIRIFQSSITEYLQKLNPMEDINHGP